MQKRTEAEWRKLVSEYRRSGLGQKAWCGSKGINLYTFRDRLTKLRKSEASDSEAVATNEEAAKAQETTDKINWLAVTQELGSCGSEIKVKIGGFEIKVTQGFDEPLFLQVCQALLKLC